MHPRPWLLMLMVSTLVPSISPTMAFKGRNLVIMKRRAAGHHTYLGRFLHLVESKARLYAECVSRKRFFSWKQKLIVVCAVENNDEYERHDVTTDRVQSGAPSSWS